MGLWKQQEGNVGVQNQVLVDFGATVELRFERLLATWGPILALFLCLCSGYSLHRIMSPNLDALGSRNNISACENQAFAQVGILTMLV